MKDVRGLILESLYLSRVDEARSKVEISVDSILNLFKDDVKYVRKVQKISNATDGSEYMDWTELESQIKDLVDLYLKSSERLYDKYDKIAKNLMNEKKGSMYIWSYAPHTIGGVTLHGFSVYSSSYSEFSTFKRRFLEGKSLMESDRFSSSVQFYEGKDDIIIVISQGDHKCEFSFIDKNAVKTILKAKADMVKANIRNKGNIGSEIEVGNLKKLRLSDINMSNLRSKNDSVKSAELLKVANGLKIKGKLSVDTFKSFGDMDSGIMRNRFKYLSLEEDLEKVVSDSCEVLKVVAVKLNERYRALYDRFLGGKVELSKEDISNLKIYIRDMSFIHNTMKSMYDVNVNHLGKGNGLTDDDVVYIKRLKRNYK